MGFFAQDLISLTPELKMMLGMRYDQYNFIIDQSYPEPFKTI